MAKRKHAYLILRSGQTLTVSVPEDPWPRQIHHRMDQGELITVHLCRDATWGRCLSGRLAAR